MFSDIASNEFLLGVAIGIAFDEVGRKLIVRRVKSILGVDECVGVEGDEDSRDDTATGSDSTSESVESDVVDYYDPDAPGGADKDSSE